MVRILICLFVEAEIILAHITRGSVDRWTPEILLDHNRIVDVQGIGAELTERKEREAVSQDPLLCSFLLWPVEMPFAIVNLLPS
jgi:hypothetical protein